MKFLNSKGMEISGNISLPAAMTSQSLYVPPRPTIMTYLVDIVQIIQIQNTLEDAVQIVIRIESTLKYCMI